MLKERGRAYFSTTIIMSLNAMRFYAGILRKIEPQGGNTLKRKITKITALILSVLFSLSSLVTTAFATGYTAMIVQGNTPDVGDCKVFFEQLKRVPGNNSYTIDNCGWHYNSGNSYHNWSRTSTQNDLADAQDLINAGLYDVLYWSGHGGRVRLNVHGSNDYGPALLNNPLFTCLQHLK